jgi:hypothetical protein
MSPVFKSANSYSLFAKKVRSSRRSILDEEDQQFLCALLHEAEADRRTVIPAGRVLWRAQLGYELEPLIQDGEYFGDLPGPFHQRRMLPLTDRAPEGRANPAGIPYLYLSNQKETALTEVRPWLGSLVSLAQFQTTRELAIVNCSTDERPRRRMSTRPPFVIISPEELDKAVWYDIDRAFANEGLAEYAPTQIIAEFFKAKGFDGIAYQSAFGGGYNFALFRYV